MRYSFLVIIILLSGCLIAQKQKSIALETGISATNIRDNYFSTITYRAALPVLKFSYIEQKIKSYDFTSVDFQYGTLKPAISNDNTQDFIQFSIVWTKVFKLKNSNGKKYTFYLGGHWTNNFSHVVHSLFGENQQSHMYHSTLGPSFFTAYSLNENNCLNAEFRINLISYILRPAYTLSIPEKTVSKENWNIWNIATGGNFASPCHFQNVHTNISFIHHFGNSLTGSARYEWNFVQYSGQNLFYRANHFIIIGLEYHFKNKK